MVFCTPDGLAAHDLRACASTKALDPHVPLLLLREAHPRRLDGFEEWQLPVFDATNGLWRAHRAGAGAHH